MIISPMFAPDNGPVEPPSAFSLTSYFVPRSAEILDDSELMRRSDLGTAGFSAPTRSMRGYPARPQTIPLLTAA